MHHTLSYALSVLCLLLAVGADLVEAQFLSRDYRRLWANELFENYGASGYRDYDLEDENRRFDLFGDLLIDGVDVVEYSEIRRDAPGIRGSFESRNARYDRFFQKLIIANEGFGSWSTRLIIGDHIRTFFTPMTLNLPSYSGIRWDGSSRKSRFSIIGTHLTDPVLASGLGSLEQNATQRRIFGTSLFGGHWESQIGDILTIGSTYVNVHRFDAEANAKTNSLRGTVPQVMQNGLRKVFVFISDDAPYRGSGAEVHQLDMFVNDIPVLPVRVGRINNLLEHLPVTTDLSSTILLQPHEIGYLRRNRDWLHAVVDASNTPFFRSLLAGITQDVAPATQAAPLSAHDTDLIYYEYVVPDTVSRIDFSAVVANDYSVDVVGAVQVPLLAPGDDDFYYDWHNAARATGQAGQRSNLRQIQFNYGFPTGLSLLGLNFAATFMGFQLQGELARSTTFFKVPEAQGKRYKRESSMYYVNMLRPVYDRAEVGFELFDVPHDYTTDFSLFFSSKVGPTVGGRLYDSFALVEDNDDLDDWPDRVERNDPLAPYLSASGQGHGVYPGFDPDGDGVLDFNLDLDRGSDATQPFIGYYAELPSLVFGDDFDNNGIVDFRENDNLPDYLYPVDHRGLHGFVSLQPTDRTQVRLGLYRVRQPALGTRNHSRYLETQYQRDWKDWGYVRLSYRIKRARDNIQNTTFFPTSDTTLSPDRLENRNSLSNQIFFEGDLTTLPALNIRNIISFTHIDLEGQILADPVAAKPGTMTRFAMVNKVDYTITRGRFSIFPQFKHIYQRHKSPELQIPDAQSRWLMPILRVDYRLTAKTMLKTGIQGLPFWHERFLDAARPESEFTRLTYTAFFQNKSNYRGYDLTILLGTYHTTKKFTGSTRPKDGFLEYFFRVYIG